MASTGDGPDGTIPHPHLMERVELLRGGWLFSECTDDELERIAALTHPIRVPAGHVVMREGDEGTEFYVVVDGTYRVTVEGEPVADVTAGSFFGEMALLDGGTRSATVITDGEVLCLAISRQRFTKVLRSEPSIAIGMLAELATRLRAAQAVG
jgi:CRP/FNR family cyclic AMP-dependent transcriptional regulator